MRYSEKIRAFSIRVLAVTCLLSFLTGAFVFTAAAAEGQAEISVNSPEETFLDSSFIATVEISGAPELIAIQYEILFDSSKIMLEKIDEGRMENGDALPVLSSEISPGHILVLHSLDSGTVGGTGILSSITFKTLQIGVSDIELANGFISGAGGEIVATWVSDSVTIVTVEPGEQEQPVTPPAVSEETPSPSEPETGNGEIVAESDPGTAMIDTPAGTESEGSTEESTTTHPALTSESENISTPVEENGNQQPVTETEGVKWPILWGIIGGVAVIIVLVVYAQFSGR